MCSKPIYNTIVWSEKNFSSVKCRKPRHKVILSMNTKMGKDILKFGDTEIEKQKLHSSRKESL